MRHQGRNGLFSLLFCRGGLSDAEIEDGLPRSAKRSNDRTAKESTPTESAEREGENCGGIRQGPRVRHQDCDLSRDRDSFETVCVQMNRSIVFIQWLFSQSVHDFLPNDPDC